jgi:hypothetical protein
VVYAVPVVLLVKGILRSSTGVGLTFALGALTIASGIVRFVCLKVGTGQENLVCKSTTLVPRLMYTTFKLTCSLIDPLSMVEMTLSIIVVALPGLKPLVRQTKA